MQRKNPFSNNDNDTHTTVQSTNQSHASSRTNITSNKDQSISKRVAYSTCCPEIGNCSPQLSFSSHNTPHMNQLAKFIMDGEWSNAISLIQHDPDCAKIWILAHQFMGSYQDSRVLPIHIALSEGNVPIEVIRVLIAAYPEGIHRVETGYKRNCVHIALKGFASDQVISYIVQLKPQSCQEQDVLGRLPLHYAISNVHAMSIVREIIHVYPEAVKSYDHDGWTPLHVACQVFSSTELIRLLLFFSPESVLMMTKRGSTPLDVAEGSRTNQKAILPILREVDDRFRKLPLLQNFQKAASKDAYKNATFYPDVTHCLV